MPEDSKHRLTRLAFVPTRPNIETKVKSDMFKFGRATAWVGVLACAFLCLPAVVLGEMSPAQEQKAKKRSRPVPGTDLFVAAPLRKIKIEITGAALEQLRRDNRQYARGTFRDGETVLRDVGVHLKGAAGSFRGLEEPLW